MVDGYLTGTDGITLILNIESARSAEHVNTTDVAESFGFIQILMVSWRDIRNGLVVRRRELRAEKRRLDLFRVQTEGR